AGADTEDGPRSCGRAGWRATGRHASFSIEHETFALEVCHGVTSRRASTRPRTQGDRRGVAPALRLRVYRHNRPLRGLSEPSTTWGPSSTQPRKFRGEQCIRQETGLLSPWTRLLSP